MNSCNMYSFVSGFFPSTEYLWDFSVLLYLSVFSLLKFCLQSIEWIKHNLLIYSPADGNLNCFQFLVLWNRTSMNIPEHIFQWTKALVSLRNLSKAGIMHCKVGVGIAFYLVCSILQPRSKVIDRVSESREVGRACVSRVSWWLVQGQRSRCWKDPQRGPDADSTRDWGRLIRNQL